MSTASDAAEALPATEAELLAWATGQRSNLNVMMQTEGWLNSAPDRNRTLAMVESADADSIRAARERVYALRTLMGLTPEGADPADLARIVARA